MEAYLSTLNAYVSEVGERVPLFTLLANVGGQLGENCLQSWIAET